MISSRFRWDRTRSLELSKPLRAYIYYKRSRLNLLTGYTELYEFSKFLKELSAITLQEKFKRPRVYHFYYELGYLFNELGHHVDETTPLVVELEYSQSRKIQNRKPRLTNLPLKNIERPVWTEYKKAFEHVQHELLEGNCYQVNLTYSYDFETDDVIDPRDINEFFFSRPGLGAFAHSTFLGDEMILSNSPECLFSYSHNRIRSMPIKGTMKREGKDWKPLWKEMKANVKEEGELLMIADLIKNDLNKLQKPRAQVKKLKAPLLVPGLLHQYSLLTLDLEGELSLLKTMQSLFPGGSVTGAPKQRVMDIIQKTERNPRGIYCGSTLLCLGEKKISSINIRTAQLSIADRLWRYGAGGGITLLSKPVQEFQEMELKVASFLTLLRAPGYVPKG
jgi:para-aminobenzoate synthetase component 1